MKKEKCRICGEIGNIKESLFNKNNLISFNNNLSHKKCVNSILNKMDEYQNENRDNIGVVVTGKIFKEEIIIQIIPTILSTLSITPDSSFPINEWTEMLEKKLDAKLSLKGKKPIRIKISLSETTLADYLSKKINLHREKIKLQVEQIAAVDEEHFIAFQKAEKRRAREAEEGTEAEIKKKIQAEKRYKEDESEKNAQYRSQTPYEEFIKNFNFGETGMESLIEINYHSTQKIRNRYFLSNENKDVIYSRDFLGNTDHNFIHLFIELAGKSESTTWNYQGDKIIGDNFESGYTLIVTMKHDDKNLRYAIIKNLQKFGFGALPSGKTIHCHKNSLHPTKNTAKKILSDIMTTLTEEEAYEGHALCRCGHAKNKHSKDESDMKFKECGNCDCVKYLYEHREITNEEIQEAMKDMPNDWKYM